MAGEAGSHNGRTVTLGMPTPEKTNNSTKPTADAIKARRACARPAALEIPRPTRDLAMLVPHLALSSEPVPRLGRTLSQLLTCLATKCPRWLRRDTDLTRVEHTLTQHHSFMIGRCRALSSQETRRGVRWMSLGAEISCSRDHCRMPSPRRQGRSMVATLDWRR